MAEHQIPTTLFQQLSEAVVPGLREVIEEMGLEPGSISPSVGMTATVNINGRDERVRVQVTLDPDEDDDEDEDA